MAQIKEHYCPKPLGANGSTKIGTNLAGFICTVSGTLTVTDADGTVLVNALPVTAGDFTRLPILSNTNAGMTVTLAGNGEGTLLT